RAERRKGRRAERKENSGNKNRNSYFHLGMKAWFKKHLSIRQYELLRALSYEWKRWLCRIRTPKKYTTSIEKLHLGCGDRHVANWLNVDLTDSDLNLDIARGQLPFADDQFSSIVSQHVVEHLTIEDELIPLLKECYRCLKLNGEIWIATPDLEKVARSYLEQKNTDMIADRQTRKPDWNLNGLPSQHFMNDLFYQQGEHRNLFDFELLEWTLRKAGFTVVERTDERALLNRFPEFPPRRDDYQSLYVKAIKSPPNS
ncbi:MAG TPA: methyltransferase domain-containing protein, partial [Saprospiraceae bacterium]|nr:methyltransferase domain-containing protein [Saprospiraceae bacterium]